MSLQQGQVKYHDLRIDYPVLDLLPVDKPVTPTLDAAAWPSFREKPDPSKYHFQLSGADFVARLPLVRRGLTSESPLVMQQDDLFDTLVCLLAGPGTSLLQIATYADRERGEMYCFRLSMVGDTHTSIVAEEELSEAAWKAEQACSQGETWMQLINDLLVRFTDRSYWHVHERLKGYRWYVKQVEEERWGWEDEFDAQKFLAQRFPMIPRRGCDVGSEEDEFDLHLRCGHQQVVVVQQMREMSDGACLNYCCNVCGSLVVQDNVNGCRSYLYLQQGGAARERFCAREANWRRLADDFPLGGRAISTTGGLLYQALHSALESLTVPESASQLPLQMAESPEFPQVLSAFWVQFAGRDAAEINDTSFRLFHDLVQKLDRAVGVAKASPNEHGNLGRVPFTWIPQFRVWLTRAVQLAGVPEYDGSDLVAVLGEYATPAEEVFEGDAAMGELEEMMESADLYYN